MNGRLRFVFVIAFAIQFLCRTIQISAQCEFVNETTLKKSAKASNVPIFKNTYTNNVSYVGVGIGKSHILNCPPIVNQLGDKFYNWAHNGVSLSKAAERVDQLHNGLVFRELLYNDTGSYTCTVQNSMGCRQHTFELFVLNETNPFKESTSLFQKLTVPCKKSAKIDCNLQGVGRRVWFQHKKRPNNNKEVHTYVKNMFVKNSKEQEMELVVNSRTRPGMRYLQFDSVDLFDQNWYSCLLADSINGKLSVLTIHLDVVEKSSTWLYYISAMVICLCVITGVIIIYMINIISRFTKRQGWIKIIKVEPISGDDSLEFQFPCIRIENKLSAVSINNEGDGAPYNEYEFPLDDIWELPRDQLHLGHELGKGTFGRVFMASWNSCITTDVNRSKKVAVKMVKDDHVDELVINLMHELEVMKLIGKHENIVNLVGACTQNGPLWVVVEYACYGNMKDFLRNFKIDSIGNKDGYIWPDLHLSDLVRFGVHVARGMSYLTSRKCIHRDLAARNVLVADNYIAKIADFGLARDIRDNKYYRKTTHGLLPLRWLAPESLAHSYFSAQSDVWSFGVFLWEIMTTGAEPFHGISTAVELLCFLKAGKRLPKPKNCPDFLYEIMQQCWQYNAAERPQISEILVKLESGMEQIIRTESCLI